MITKEDARRAAHAVAEGYLTVLGNSASEQETRGILACCVNDLNMVAFDDTGDGGVVFVEARYEKGRLIGVVLIPFGEDAEEYCAAVQDYIGDAFDVEPETHWLNGASAVGTMTTVVSPRSVPFLKALFGGKVEAGPAVYDHRTGEWTFEASLPIEPTAPPSALGAYGVPKKGKKGKTARW